MVEKLITELDALGIKLWLDEDNLLHYKAPEGTMTPERIRTLRDNKELIIEYLLNEKMIKEVFHDKEGSYEAFPLTDIQAAYLVGRNTAYDLGGVGCHGYVELTMPVMDKVRLEKALHKVVDRHSMLRAIVLKNGVQKVLKDTGMPQLGFQDLRTYEKEEALKAVDEVRSKLENKVYNPEIWPLYDFYLSTLKDCSILHCSIDMLIADFVSVDIILKELDFYYYNQDKALEDLTVTYRDIIISQKQQEKILAGEKIKEKDWEYWKTRLDELPGKPDMPVKDEKDLSASFEKYRFELDKEKWNIISQKAQDESLTPSSVILSVFADVIKMHSKSEKFCINLTQLKRPDIHPQIGNIVGDFTSVEVLEVNSEGDFLKRTHQLQQRLWNDLEHGSISGIEILREAGKVQNTNLIIPVVYTSTLGLYSGSGEDGQFMRNAEITYRISQTPQVWIDCQVSEYNNGLEINWDVREGVFPEGFIENAFEVFRTAIEGLAENLSIWNSETVCRLSKRMLRIRNEANETKKDIDNSGNILRKFWDYVVKTPNNPAVICNDIIYDYKEVALYTQTIIKNLKEQDCKAGDIIAILQKKGIWQIASVIGILSIGGTYLPIDCGQPDERISLIIKDSGASFLISDESNENTFDIKSVKVNKLHKSNDFMIPVIRADYPAYIIYTSGTTGVPKGVVMSHNAALNTIRDINEKFCINSEDKVLSLASLAFDLSVYDIFGIFDVGGTLVLPLYGKEKDPQHWEELIRVHGITLWNTVPAMMQLLTTYLDSVDNAHTYNLRNVLLSGDWIPVHLPNNIKNYFTNSHIISLGGATEGGIWSIYYEIKDVNIESNSIPYGKPLSNQRFYILDSRLQDVPDLVTGKLFIAGDSLADEYHKSPELTKNKFIIYPRTGERIYDTGDIGRYLEDGNIEFQGRSDNQVKIRGHRIELSEIEGVSSNNPKIQNAIAIKTKKEKLALFAEAASNSSLNGYEFSRMVDACYEAGDNSLKEVNRELFLRWVELSDKTTLYEIMAMFYQLGIFTDTYSLYKEEELRKTLGVQTKYNRLLKRWLNVLCSQNLIEYVGEVRSYRRKIAKFNSNETKLYRTEFERVENELHYGKELYDYMKESNEHILDLLQGRVDPLALFFPEGKTDIAMAAYNDNLVNHSLNSVVKAGLKELIRTYTEMDGKHTIRILEIGAGVGGTTVDILPALKGLDVEYMFTDVSGYFINEAKNKFADYPFVCYGIFDINKNYSEQGLLASSWDIIICANVLHNSKNAPKVLSVLRELLLPQGSMIVIEATRESFSLLTSLEFKEGLSGFTDSRKGTDRTFFERKQWNKMFTDVDGQILCTYPREEDPVAMAGQSVFLVKMNSLKSRVRGEEVKDYLINKLPSYMVPERIEILPTMPVSNNGKIDRKKLLSRIVENESFTTVKEKFDSLLEENIANIWKEVLNVIKVGRHENFYVAGGDSLLIAQVVSKIHDNIKEAGNVQWDTLMRLMLQNMTIAEFASALLKLSRPQMVQQDKKKENTALVTFKEAEKTKKRAKVLFHAGTGTLTPYNKLLGLIINKAEKNEGILGFSFGDEKYYLQRDITSLIIDTAQYYAELLSEKGYEEYELIGYCMGGWIAIETGRALTEYGLKVSKVTTISTSLGTSVVNNELLLEAAFANVVGARIDKKFGGMLQDAISHILVNNNNSTITTEELCTLNGKYEILGKHFTELSLRSEKERLDEIFESISEPQEEIIKNNNRMLYIVYRLFSANYKGVLAYTPEPYLGRIRALIVKDKSRHFFQLDKSATEEKMWDEIALGELDIQYIDGNHQTCLDEENVGKIVDLL